MGKTMGKTMGIWDDLGYFIGMLDVLALFWRSNGERRGIQCGDNGIQWGFNGD
jgi:hypothetical protein